MGEEGLPLQQDFKGRCQLSAVRQKCPLPRQEVSHRILPGSLKGGQTRQDRQAEDAASDMVRQHLECCLGSLAD